MDTGSLLLVIALIILVVFIISRPFYSRDAADRMDTVGSGSPSENALSEMMGEKERLLNALRDIDADHDLEKVPDDAYTRQRALLLQAAARNLRAIDEMEQNSGENPEDDQQRVQIDDLPARVGEQDEIEDMIADRRRKRNEKSAGFCPRCGKPLQKSDHFCPACGARVKDTSGG
jgi:rubrerythrin